MSTPDPVHLTSHLRRMAAAAMPRGGLPDAELVRRFAAHRDGAAFEVLVWRHGPMVWAACRRVLRHHQDAEDAFQAAFLALARSALSVGPRGSVGGWLHRVAVNAALKIRSRRRDPAPLPDVPAPPAADPSAGEFLGAVDEEIGHLPDHYRAAFVLCCLEGMSNAEAARELGCPVGTVDSRLHAARTRLRARLARRGLGPEALAGLGVAAAVPGAVSAAAVGLGTATRTPSPVIARLAHEAGRTMHHRTVTLAVTAAALLVGLAAAAVWGFDRPPAVSPLPEPTRPVIAPAPEPANADAALLFTELVLKPGETGSHTLRLVRADFRDGWLVRRDDLHTGDAPAFGYQARYRVVGGRYVVLESATVVDAVEKKVLHSFAGGRVLAVEGTRVYFYNNKVTGEQGVFGFDVATGKRKKVAEHGSGRWGLRGARSPDGTKAMVRVMKGGVGRIGAELPYTLAVDRVSRPREQAPGMFAATCGTTGAGFVPDEPPGVWLDNDRFLTQATLGTVVVLDTTRNTQETVVEIPLTHKPGEKTWETIGAMGFTPLGLQQPRFSLLPDGRVAYEADRVYFIDVGTKTWETAAWRSLGRGFEYSAVPDIKDVDRYTKTATVALRHRGEVIGTSDSVWWTTSEKPRAVTAEGYLAVIERVQQPGKVVPTDAVRVWSAATGEWQLLDAWADSVIGWIK